MSEQGMEPCLRRGGSKGVLGVAGLGKLLLAGAQVGQQISRPWRDAPADARRRPRKALGAQPALQQTFFTRL